MTDTAGTTGGPVPPGRHRRKLPRRVYLRRRAGVALVAALVIGALVWVATGAGREAGAPERTAGTSTTAATAPPATRPATTTTTTRGPLGSGEPVTIAFGGDVAFEGVIAERLALDPASVMAPIAETLSAADLAVVNLETAVTDGGTPAPKQFVFRASTAAWDALEAAGVDVASVANNHGMDFGVEGLVDTLQSAEAAGMPVVGGGMTEDEAYAPYEVEVNGQRIAVIGATQVLDSSLIDAWTAEGDEPGLASAKRVDRLTEEVRAVRPDADTVVVFLHWGIEQHTCPSADQMALADALVDAGADIVVGGHAHRLQGAGMLDDAFVAYGLGNFTFIERSADSANTGVLHVTATGRRIDGYRFEPGVLIGGLHQPLGGGEAEAALARWEALRDCTDLEP